ncbi:MAG TPA: DUF4145 domain-containing protein [Flavipsychrobacter sp.]
MNNREFTTLVELSNRTEADKATLIAYYLYKIKGIELLSLRELSEQMAQFGLSQPNIARLKGNLLANKLFVKTPNGNLKLSLKTLEKLEKQYPSIGLESEDVKADETVLPAELFRSTRGYIEKVAKQINGCYQHNLFDGCAMLMRRLIEMLLIMTYKHLQREDEIRDKEGNYQALSYIINYSLSKRVLSLSKDSEEVLDDFRQLGNYSAHGLEYTCKKGDLKKVKLAFRACVEELIYKCGVKK